MTSPQVTGEPQVTHQSNEYSVHFVIDLSWQSFEFSCPSLFGGIYYPSCTIPLNFRPGTSFIIHTSAIPPLPFSPFLTVYAFCFPQRQKELCILQRGKGILMAARLFSSCCFLIISKSEFIGLYILAA